MWCVYEDGVKVPDLSDWKRGIIAVLLFVLDALLEKKEYIKCDGAGYYSKRLKWAV